MYISEAFPRCAVFTHSFVPDCESLVFPRVQYVVHYKGVVHPLYECESSEVCRVWSVPAVVLSLLQRDSLGELIKTRLDVGELLSFADVHGLLRHANSQGDDELEEVIQ